jgi:hypothetical protein
LKQYLADAMAGAESEAEAHDSVKGRVAKLLAGDLSRQRGDGTAKPDTLEGRAIKLAKAFIRDQLKAANAKAEKEQIDEAAKELVKDDPKWTKEAKTQLDAETSMKAETSDAATSIIAGLLAKAKTPEPTTTE